MTDYKKINRTLALAFALLLFVIALLYFLPDRQAREALRSDAVFVFDGKTAGDIQAVSVVNEQDAFVLYRQGKSFATNQLQPAQIDAGAAGRYLEQMTRISVRPDPLNFESAAALTEALGSYGLDKPAAIARIRWADGEISSFILGMLNRADDTYYVCIEGYPSIFSMDQENAGLLLTGAKALRNLTLCAVDNSGKEKIDRLRILENGKLKMSLQLREAAPDGSVSYYTMLEPVRTEVSWSLMQSGILDHIAELKANAVAADAGALNDYGLEAPAYCMETTRGTDVLRLLFSAAQDGTVYATREGEPTIYTVDSAAVSFLQQTYLDLLGGYAYQGNAANVADVAIETAERTYRLDISGSGDSLSATLNGASVPRSQVTALFDRLNTIYIEGENALSADNDAAIRIRIRYRDSRQADTIAFVPLDERTYAVVINGNAYYYTYARVVDDLDRLLRQLGREAPPAP